MATGTVPVLTDLGQAIFPHLQGCPVRDNPNNEALAARVEVYRATPPGMDTRDGRSVYPAAIIVTQCHECGAMTHQR